MKAKRNLLLLGMALVIPMYLFVIVNTFAAPWTFLKRNSPILLLITLLAAAIMLLISLACRRHEAFLTCHARKIRVFCVLVFFLIQLFFGSQMRFIMSSDCDACYGGAIEWVQNGALGDYYHQWLSIVPNCFGLFAFNVLVLRFMSIVPVLAGVHPYYVLMTVNAVLFAMGFWAMMKLAERMRGGVGQVVFAANMALCTPMLYCVSELYTDALSMPFLMLAICLITRMIEAKSERFAHALAALSGAVVLVGMELRATVAIVAVAMVIVAVLLCKPRRLLCLATMLAILMTGHTAFIRYRDRVLGEDWLYRWRMPAVHWLVMGTPDPYGLFNGSFNNEDFLYARNLENVRQREEVLWPKLYEKVYALRYPDRLLSAISRKTLNTFGDGTFDLRQIFGSQSSAPEALKRVLIDDSSERDIYRHISTGIQMAQLFFLCACVAQRIKTREAGACESLCAVSLVGIFLVLLVWESSGRYFFHYMPAALMLSALGQIRIADGMKLRLTGRKGS